MRGRVYQSQDFIKDNGIKGPVAPPPEPVKEKELGLEDLCGTHELYGVDFDCNGVGNGIRFILDGVTYEVTEDEVDGYRSCANALVISEANVFNLFPAVSVSGHMEDEKLILVDSYTGKEVIRVGTDHSDDWYPYFVHSFTPENMFINKKEEYGAV